MAEKPRQKPPDADYASLAEARAAIESLTPADLAKLTIIARHFCRRRLPGGRVAGGDLLNDAVAKTLSGERRWRKARVSIVKHLDRVMESDSGHIAAATPVTQTEEAVDDPPLEEAAGRRQGAGGSEVEARAVAREEYESVCRMFADDESALRVLVCRAKGMRGSEIMHELAMAKTEYETTCKRILRKLTTRNED